MIYLLSKVSLCRYLRMFCATEGMPRELRYVPTYTHTSRRDAKKLKWAYGTILYDVLHMYLYVYMCRAPQTEKAGASAYDVCTYIQYRGVKQ